MLLFHWLRQARSALVVVLSGPAAKAQIPDITTGRVPTLAAAMHDRHRAPFREAMSSTSQPHSLLSIAKLNIARSLRGPSTSGRGKQLLGHWPASSITTDLRIQTRARNTALLSRPACLLLGRYVRWKEGGPSRPRWSMRAGDPKPTCQHMGRLEGIGV
jgi:hypothetical protein